MIELRFEGFSSDGKIVIGNCFQFCETYGIDIEDVFLELRNKNMLISWMDYYISALSSGMKKQNIISRINGIFKSYYNFIPLRKD